MASVGGDGRRTPTETAVAWARSALGAPVREVVALSGGLTSTMLALTDAAGGQSVLRLMTEEPWRAHGAALTRRERAAQQALVDSSVPAPTSLALDEHGSTAGVSAHLMTRVPGRPRPDVDDVAVVAMAEVLARIHDVTPDEPFRAYESWAWEAKRVVPGWTRHPSVWRRAFDVLAEAPPPFEPLFLHRDFSHRNLLWEGDAVTGVVDWVETSTGPAALDAGHAATNLAMASGPGPAAAFLAAYTAESGRVVDRYWLVMDAVGFLPPPGRAPMFGHPTQLSLLDDWLAALLPTQR